MKNNPRAVGFTRALDADVMDEGAWETLPDGTQVWRLAIRSPGASAIRLHFKDFSVADGQVWLYTGEGDQRQVAGPYTGGGVFGDGDFWSPLLRGDTVTLEHHGKRNDEPYYRVADIAHFGWDGLNKSKLNGQRAAQAACPSNNAADFPAWRNTAASVGLILIQVATGGWGACTGTLVNDRNNSGRLLFLTANHCVSTEVGARTALVYWHYDSFLFGNGYQQGPGDMSPLLSYSAGAHLVATASVPEGDGTLLELLTSPPLDVTYSGWNAADPVGGTPVLGIHHEMGSWKRISFGISSLTPSASVAGIIKPSDYFLQSTWYSGTTEQGSSGSALFDQSSGAILGILDSSKGNGCPQATSWVSFYGRFSSFFPRVQTQLNNIPQGTCNVTISGMNHTAPVQGENGTFNVGAPSQCTWAVASDSDWITITSPKVGMGNGTVSYAVSPNTSLLSGPRLGSLSVIGEQRRVVHIDQPGTDGFVPYLDVPASHPYFDQTTFLRWNNATADQCAPYQFCPDGVTTRGLMSQFIIRAIYGGDQVINSIPFPPVSQFDDVPSSHPYYRYIMEMRYLGITVGCSPTSYCPDRPVTRSEMSVFIIRALIVKNLLTNQEFNPLQIRQLIAGDSTLINTFSYTSTPLFTDVPSTHPHFVYVQKMKDLGITSGCLTGTTYCPNDPNTRGQISVFLARGLFALWNSRPN